MNIIISGKQGSGKTTTADALLKALDTRYKRAGKVFNYADVIYRMHDAVQGILYEYYPARDEYKDGPLLQLLGTEWGRKTIDDLLWVKILQRRIQLWHLAYQDLGGAIGIIADARFENEFDAFPDALRVRLECPEEIRKKRCSSWRENTQHQSEIGLDQYVAGGKFDMTLFTDQLNTEGCVELIMAKLMKNDWLERRGHA